MDNLGWPTLPFLFLSAIKDKWNRLVCKLNGHLLIDTGERYEDIEFVGNPTFGTASDDAIFGIYQCTRCGLTQSKFEQWK
jgi:hypothetical protein